MCVAIGAIALFSGIPNAANATQLVRELYDNLSKGPLQGKVNDSSSVGFDTNASWQVSPAGNTSMSIDPGMDVWDWLGVDGNSLLSYSFSSGALMYYGADGNMDTTLTNPATSLPYGDFASQCYATRALATNSYIDFNANGTYYFSFRVIKGISWWNGDTAGGYGFASSGATNADFVGVGVTLDSFLAPDGVTDISDTVYITAGKLNQPGTAYNIDPVQTGGTNTDGGPYYPQAYGPAQLTPANSGGWAIVGMLTTTVGGASTLSAYVVPQYSAIPSNPAAITWSSTYSFTETNVMTQLLLFEHGTGSAGSDAIRVGTTWADVVGLEFNNPMTVSPAGTIYSGVNVTLSQAAGLNTSTYPMSFQWFTNGVAIDPTANPTATNSSLTLNNVDPSFTATYSVVVSNYFGMLTNSVPITVLGQSVPVFTTQPAPTVQRYNGGTVEVTVGVSGTAPYGLQLQHAGTNVVPAVTASLSVPGTATLAYGPIGTADVGSYTVKATNAQGSATSAASVLSLLAPPRSSYAAAVAALLANANNGGYGYWRLDDAGNNTGNADVADQFNGNDGVAIDTTSIPANILFGLPGVPYVGFPTPHRAIGTHQNGSNGGAPSRVNLSVLPYLTNTMTFTLWVSNGCDIMVGSYDTNNPATFGLETASSTSDILFNWGSGIQSDTGLVLPANAWTFVALVVTPTNATVYMGTNASALTVVDSGPLTIPDSTTLGYTNLSPLALGRVVDPGDDGIIPGNPPAGWSTLNCSQSDVAVFNQSLTAQQITSLYLASGVTAITATPDGSGNLVLNWTQGGILQQASSVTGPYTDVDGSPVPPYSVPLLKTGNVFYRVRF